MNATLPEVIARVSVSMSNLSIIQRLEQRLSAYAAGELARADFVDFLGSSIAALENVPMSVSDEARTHAEAIDMAGYFDEEGFQSDQLAAQESLRAWLRGLTALYCVQEPPCS